MESNNNLLLNLEILTSGLNSVGHLDTAKHAYEARGNRITHNDDKVSHLNTIDAQLTQSAFEGKEIVCKPQVKQNNGIKRPLDANS